jgi:hypothetical protein
MKKFRKKKSPINDLNIDCLKQIIKKLTIEQIFRIERVDKRFQYCVKEVLKQQKVIRFDENGVMFCRHSANNLQTINRKIDINSDEFKAFLEKCPNIHCLQMSEIFINESLFKLISKYCKQLVCIHLFGPKSGSKSPQIAFKEIGKLLSDRIEIEINFSNATKDYMQRINYMREDSIIALIQNMPQIKNIGFDSIFQSIRKSFPYFGLNLRSLTITDCHHLSFEDFNAIKNYSNLTELSLSFGRYQNYFDFICDNFSQLKSFSIQFKFFGFISLTKLFQLNNLENLRLKGTADALNTYSFNKNNCFKKLLTIELMDILIAPNWFHSFVQISPNIEKLSINSSQVKCEHQIKRNDCFQCIQRVFKSISELNCLKVLQINDFNSNTFKAIISNTKEQTFERLEELKLKSDSYSRHYKSKKTFIDLIYSLTQFCGRNTKQLFTLEINSIFMEFITQKQIINGVQFNVFFDCEKFEEKIGKRFEIPKNMRIIRYKKRAHTFF